MYTVAQKMKQAMLDEPNIAEMMAGGIYTFEETGRNGITFTTCPQAFKGARLLPCMLIKSYEMKPTQDIRDEQEQIMSYNELVHIYVYQEDGQDIIEETYNWVYTQLQDRNPFDNVRCNITNMPEGRQDESLNGAHYIRIDCMLYGIKLPETR